MGRRQFPAADAVDISPTSRAAIECAVSAVFAELSAQADPKVRQVAVAIVDRQLLRLALLWNDNHKGRAARMLGLHRNGMRDLLRRHGVTPQ